MQKKPYNKYMIKNIWKNYGQRVIEKLTAMVCRFTGKIVKSGLESQKMTLARACLNGNGVNSNRFLFCEWDCHGRLVVIWEK